MQPSIRDDSTLLARWALENSEQAFTEIVRNYERLVLGAALRRTGNIELARDVAQQVFATLANKARLLIGRTSIAGWLYHAASNIAARTAQSERRREARQQYVAERDTDDPSDMQWPLVEEALAAIGATDRESLVMHYFEDLAYPEIAAVLGIQEAAARKRVSRALRNLETQIRRRGLQGSTAGLLAAAAAQQSSLTTQAGLASAALATSGAHAAPWLTFTMIMSHTSIKIAACASALVLAPIFAQRHANANLRAQIGTQHAAHPEIILSSDRHLRARANLESEFAAKHAARIATENRLAQLATFKESLDQEVVISLGSIESMARKLAHILSIMNQLDTKPGEKLEPTAVKERERQAHQAAEALPEVLSILRELPKLERDPDKAAHFYAMTIAETIGLDQDARVTMEADIAQWMRGLQQEGLALIQRPQGTAKEWDDRRDAATARLLTSLRAKLPPAQQKHPAIEEFFQLSLTGSDGLYDILTAGSPR